MSYQDYLAGEHWKQKRDRVMTRCGETCECCWARPARHIHHRTYARLGREELGDLLAVCSRCHAKLHGLIDLPSGIHDWSEVAKSLLPQPPKPRVKNKPWRIRKASDTPYPGLID